MKTLLTRTLIKCFVFIGVLLASFNAQAKPQSTYCNALIQKALQTGSVPQVNIDPIWGITRIIEGEFYCREPIEVWGQRGLPWPIAITPDAEAPTYLFNRDKAVSPVKESEKGEPTKPNPPLEGAQPTPLKAVTVPAKTLPPAPPRANPYLSSNKLPSIISGQHDIPTTVKIEEGDPSVPKLADLVQSKMAPKAQEDPSTKAAHLDPKQTGIDYLQLALWVAIASLIFGVMAVLFFTLYKPKAHPLQEEEEEEEEKG